MYLLEAKRRAEKEAAAELRAQQRRIQLEAKNSELTRPVDAPQRGVHVQHVEHSKRSGNSGATEAQEALIRAARPAQEAARQWEIEAAQRREQADIQEAIRRSADEQCRGEAASAATVVSQPLVDLELSALQWEDVQVRCSYIGTFEVNDRQAENPELIKKGLRAMAEYMDAARPAVLILCLEGIKVIDARTQKVAMAHALSRVVLAEHVESPLFFGFVARNPGVENKYCHVFGMEKKNHAQQVHGLVTKAFRLAFAKDRTIKLKSKAQKEPVQGVPATPPLHAQTSARPAAPVARPSNETPICPRSPVPGHTPASQLHQKPPLKQQQRQQRQQEEHQQQQQEQQQAQLLLPQAVAQRSAEINRTNGRAWAKHNPLEGMSRPPRLIASKPIQGISERVTSSQGGGTHHLPHHAVAEPKLVLLPAVPSQTSKAVGKQLPPKQSWPEQAQLAANVPTAVQPRGNLTPTTPTAPPIEDPDYGDALDSEFDDMSTAAWYQAGIPREIAMELLSLSEDGAFMVRDSQTQPGNFALTMKAQDMMHHFIIRLVPGGFVLGSSEMAQMPFPTLSVLIQHYAVEAGCLPRPLSMLSFNRLYSEDPPTTPTMHAAFDDKPSSFVDPNYQSLKDVLAAAV